MSYADQITLDSALSQARHLGITEQLLAITGPITYSAWGEARAEERPGMAGEIIALLTAAWDAQPKPEVLCQCGCGASWAGWSTAGRHLRKGVTRVYVEAHGTCHCGRYLDQYGECSHGVQADEVGSIIAEYGMLPVDVADSIAHGQQR